MRNSDVALKICKEYSHEQVLQTLKDCIDLLGGIGQFVKPNQTVLIKPDLYHGTKPNISKTTNPNVISALAEIIAKVGAKCIIADSPKGNFNQLTLDNVYDKTQMLKASNNGNAMLNSNDNITIISNPKGERCREIHVIDAINDADIIINVGKIRCDKNLGLVGCAQNLFGLVPGRFKDLVKTRCYTTKAYHNYIIDLYETLEQKVVLNILDGIVSCESNGDPRILNSIIVGENPYSVDATALKIINQHIDKDVMLAESARRGKFDYNFKILGDNHEQLICCDFNYNTPKSTIKKGSDASFKRQYNAHQKRPIIQSKECKGCKICVNDCPMKAINIKIGQLGEYADIDYSKCINCFKCANNCPYQIIKTKTPKKYRHIDKMMKKINKPKQK